MRTPGASRSTPRPPARSSTPTSGPTASASCRWRRTFPPRWPAPTAPGSGSRSWNGFAQHPALIRDAGPPGAVKVGLKLFNSLDDDAFQLAMLAAVHDPGVSRPDYLIYANRLFDPERVFDGHRGIAYGGPDLSDRNLRLLGSLRAGSGRGPHPARRPGYECHRRHRLGTDGRRVSRCAAARAFSCTRTFNFRSTSTP